jgi:hypothetical protein
VKPGEIRYLYRGINVFKRGYQPTSNFVKDENGDFLADSHNILNRWKNYFSRLPNVHRVSDVKQREYIQLSYSYLIIDLLKLKLLLQN